jgi:hypothetical protein
VDSPRKVVNALLATNGAEEAVDGLMHALVALEIMDPWKLLAFNTAYMFRRWPG